MTAANTRPARRFGLILIALTCVANAPGCGPEAGGAAEDPGYTITSPDTAPRTTPRPTDGSDALSGTGGDDALRAGDGDDVVRGSGGNDRIYGGEGKDELYGGPGDDVIDAQDPGSVGAAGRDRISCGPGRDEVLMDANDEEKPRDCETAGVGAS